MQLRQLATFVAIAQTGTLTAAAARLHKTQGAVSHDLRTLERALAVLLVDRTGQRIRLTPAGEALLPHALELLRRVDDIKREIGDIEAGGAIPIRFGTPPSLSSRVLDQILAYRTAVPDARFTLFTELQATLVDWLIEGRLDIVIAEPELRADISSIVLGKENILITVPKDDPLAKQTQISPQALIGRPFIGFIRELASTRLAERFFTSLGYYPSPVVELDDYRLIKDLIRRSLGFAIMPESAIEDDGDLVGIPGDPPLQREIAVMTPANRLVRQSVVVFRDHLASSWAAPLQLQESEQARAGKSHQSPAEFASSPPRGRLREYSSSKRPIPERPESRSSP
jgi:DNA-binding transcriptional LysR family regulator